MTPSLFAARGIVPIAYALFAFILGVALGMLIRRAVPAMAATLGLYAAVAIAMPEWIRQHLIPASHATHPLDTSALDTLMIGDGDRMTVIGDDNLPDAWVLANRSVTATGDLFVGPADPQYCGEAASPEACRNWVDSLGLRQDLTYHPDSHFWPLQWAESGILIGMAALLAGFCFWWIRRRVS